MMTNEKTRNVAVSGDLAEVAAYHINPENIGHIAAILRDMYPQPVLAVVREYCANALDAHVQVGKVDVPIQVTVPTMFAPVFKVRDFGPGLSEEDTKKLLYGYACSGDHKRDSNEQIGGFGIGCKCAFAITDQFQYTVIHKGVKSVWTSYLDETDVGRAAKLESGPADEPDGIEVSIPVPSDRVTDFQKTLKSAFQFYPTKPELTNPDSVELEDGPDILVSGVIDVNCEDGLGNENTKVRWNLHASPVNPDHPVALMGPLAYPIQLDSLGLETELKDQVPQAMFNTSVRSGQYTRNMWHNNKFWANFSLELPIGWLQIAPTRESLQYSKRTIRKLVAVLGAMSSEDFGDRLITVLGTGIKAGTTNGLKMWPKILEVKELWGRSGSIWRLLDWNNDQNVPKYLCASGEDSLRLVLPADVGGRKVQSFRVDQGYGRRRNVGWGNYFRVTTDRDEEDLEDSRVLIGSGEMLSSRASNHLVVLTGAWGTAKLATDDGPFGDNALSRAFCRVPGAEGGSVPRVWIHCLPDGDIEKVRALPWAGLPNVHCFDVSELPADSGFRLSENGKTPAKKAKARSSGGTKYEQHGKKFLRLSKTGGTCGDPRSAYFEAVPASDMRSVIKKAESEGGKIVYAVVDAFKMRTGGGDYPVEPYEVRPVWNRLASSGFFPSETLYAIRESDAGALKNLPEAVEVHEYTKTKIDAIIGVPGGMSVRAAQFWMLRGADWKWNPERKETDDSPLSDLLHLPAIAGRDMVKRFDAWKKDARDAYKKWPDVCKYLMSWGKIYPQDAWVPTNNRSPRGGCSFFKPANGMLGSKWWSEVGPHWITQATRMDRTSGGARPNHSLLFPWMETRRGEWNISDVREQKAVWVATCIGSTLLPDVEALAKKIPFTFGSVMRCLPGRVLHELTPKTAQDMTEYPKEFPGWVPWELIKNKLVLYRIENS